MGRATKGDEMTDEQEYTMPRVQGSFGPTSNYQQPTGKLIRGWLDEEEIRLLVNALRNTYGLGYSDKRAIEKLQEKLREALSEPSP